jgi:hypothetical protein
MVDVGAKFASNGPLLQAATRFIGIDLKTTQDSDLYRMRYILLNLRPYITRVFTLSES